MIFLFFFFFLSLAAIVSLCAHKEEGFSFSPACPHGPPACRWPRCQPCYCIIYCIETVVSTFFMINNCYTVEQSYSMNTRQDDSIVLFMSFTVIFLSPCCACLHVLFNFLLFVLNAIFVFLFNLFPLYCDCCNEGIFSSALLTSQSLNKYVGS